MKNFSMLVSHVLVPPAMKADSAFAVQSCQGLIAPGHVCTVVGVREYERLAEGIPRAHRGRRV